MPNLAVTETESAACKVTGNTSPNACSHRTITYDVDGASRTLRTGDAELATPLTTEELDQMVSLFMRFRRARGKAEIGVRIG